MKKSPKKLNFIFWGTPEVASQTLEILKEHGYRPELIVTAPDRPKGRGMEITPPPVKVWAEKNKIPYLQDLEKLSDMPEYDLSIVVAFGKILSKEILDAPKLGSINVHYSLLPKYRGASPVESAILAGEIETGVTIQRMVYKMDAGPILAQEKVAILPDETASELRKRLTGLGAAMLAKLLGSPDWKETPQDESLATYSKKIKKEDGLVDLNDDSIKNYNKFRAYAEWPRTYFFRRNLPAGRQERIIITDAELKDGQFRIKRVIPEGGKEMDWKA